MSATRQIYLMPPQQEPPSYVRRQRYTVTIPMNTIRQQREDQPQPPQVPPQQTYPELQRIRRLRPPNKVRPPIYVQQLQYQQQEHRPQPRLRRRRSTMVKPQHHRLIQLRQQQVIPQPQKLKKI